VALPPPGIPFPRTHPFGEFDMLTLKQSLAALLLPAAALAGAASVSADETKAPMQCQISVKKDQNGHMFEAVMKAIETVQGVYELNLNGNGNVISNAGDFYVKAGDTQILSQTRLGLVSLDDVDAELILHVDGKKYACALQPEA